MYHNVICCYLAKKRRQSSTAREGPWTLARSVYCCQLCQPPTLPIESRQYYPYIIHI